VPRPTQPETGVVVVMPPSSNLDSPSYGVH
jgi:hypothetical protein